jgi:hypothetical protein
MYFGSDDILIPVIPGLSSVCQQILKKLIAKKSLLFLHHTLKKYGIFQNGATREHFVPKYPALLSIVLELSLKNERNAYLDGVQEIGLR